MLCLSRPALIRSIWPVPLAMLLLSSVCTADEASPQTPPVLLQMIRDDSVHEDLRLNESQKGQVLAALRKVDGRWFRARNMPADKQKQEIDSLTDGLNTDLAGVLDPQQISRLRQLERQALGTRMVLRNDVADELGLTDTQLIAFRESFLDTDKKSAQIQKAMMAGEKDGSEANNEINRIKAKERQSLVSMLTNEQKSKLGSLTGTPFNFAKVRRTYPLAPELDASGVTWVQGGPVKLEDLRGKVVAVHFYAFQCINCQRNFPHYQAWHEDYADKDLVIIGIQTPETSSERQFDRVAAAAKNDGMEYPVMLDAESSNWKSWSNTMWPTVYLIDKQGFIRRWWQGEMNWKGTPGEQQMRQTIEQLLGEDS